MKKLINLVLGIILIYAAVKITVSILKVVFVLFIIFLIIDAVKKR